MNVLAQMLPDAASNLATDIDWAWRIILWTTTVFFFIVVGAMFFFIIKYRRRTQNDVTSPITHNTPIEIIWTVVPLIIVIAFFFVGFKGFLAYDNPPPNCVVITSEAQQWSFLFKYPNGGEDENLYLKVGQPVRIDLLSKDVLHAFYVPEFRTQRNYVPGRVTNVWFVPTKTSPKPVKKTASSGPATASAPAAAPVPATAAATASGPASQPAVAYIPTEEEMGGWPIFCTQFCGDRHSRMVSRVHVLEEAEYEEKMKEIANPFKKKIDGKNYWVPYVELGKKLYTQMSCNSCHTNTPDEATGTGPPWHGLYGRDHQFSATTPPGYTLVKGDLEAKWDDYLRESMIQPDAKLVRFTDKKGVTKDYHGMTSYATSLAGSMSNMEKQRALAAYIKSLGGPNGIPWKPEVTPDANAELFNADEPKLFETVGTEKIPVHPESLAGKRARDAGGTAPATTLAP